MLKKDRSIIHVEVKATGEHLYYGSVAAMFEDPSIRGLLGIAYQTFRKKNFSEAGSFENENIIVRKGFISTINHNN